MCFGNHFHYCAVSVLQSGLNREIISTVKVSQSTMFNLCMCTTLKFKFSNRIKVWEHHSSRVGLVLDYSKDLKWMVVWQKINFQNIKNKLFQPVPICTCVTHMTTSKIASLVKTTSTFKGFKQIEEMEEIFVEDLHSLLSSPLHLATFPEPCSAFRCTWSRFQPLLQLSVTCSVEKEDRAWCPIRISQQ